MVEDIEIAEESKIEEPKIVEPNVIEPVKAKQVKKTKRIKTVKQVKKTKSDKELVQEFASGKNWDLSDPQVYYAILKNIKEQ